MEFKEVAHLYLGCTVSYTAVYKPELEPQYEQEETAQLEHFNFGALITRKNVKPILRRPDDMNSIEMMEFVNLIPFYKRSHTFDFELRNGAIYFRISYSGQFNSYKKREEILTNNPDQFFYLLSKHFDLFGLIDSGEAIDAATINPNPYQ